MLELNTVSTIVSPDIVLVFPSTLFTGVLC